MHTWESLFHSRNFYPRSPCGERLSSDDFEGVPFYFYPRSPCGERRRFRAVHDAKIDISIHALLAESDGTVAEAVFVYYISIHALLAESDARCKVQELDSIYFYPRSPCGERLAAKPFFIVLMLHFYPRSPCGERRKNF